ncbi:MAG: sigma-70 family RNA polymerase sigma factor [Sedimentisphaerales bacterium]|nr:sigma-70 family RNA polymerase sigma factor [Sedimentisphaerales bacterium]
MVEYDADSRRQGGAVAAAVKVFAEHGNFVRSVIRLRVRDASRREDLFQELFLKLVDQPIPFDVQNVRGYLYRAILNDAVDLAREREEEKRQLRKYVERNEIFIHKRPSQSAIPRETDERKSVFANLTRQLPRREAQVVTLRYQDDFSIAEIAAAVGVDKRTVSRYLTSALRGLRGKLVIE